MMELEGENLIFEWSNVPRIVFEDDWEFEIDLDSNLGDDEEAQSLKLSIYTYYANSENRLRSYKNWPKVLNQKPKDLCASGFFYSKYDDKVVCFACGGKL